jgi:ADP-heptose:LPS heptosyltransferase
MTSKRYAGPKGIHGLRRKVVRWLLNLVADGSTVLSDQLLPRRGIYRILICRTSHSLGNTLLLTPLLSELELTYPGAEVDIVTQSPIAEELYRRFFSVRRVLVLPSRFPPHLPWVLRVVRELRKTHYDLVIDPDRRSKTGRVLLALSHARFRLGFAGIEKAGSLTHAVAVPEHVRHIAQLPVYLLRTALGSPSPSAYPGPNVCLSQDERAKGADVLARLTGDSPAGRLMPVIGIFANATGSKRLDESWWKDFLDQLEIRAPGHRFVEFAPIQGASMLSLRYPTHYCSDLRKLSAVVASLALFISVDSGVMHLAWASGCATAGLFTGTDIAAWGPYGGTGFALDVRQLSPADVAERVVQFATAQPASLAPREPLQSSLA